MLHPSPACVASRYAAAVWYHGSPKRFDEFQTGVAHTFGSGPSEVPLFFTPDKRFARDYAGGKGTIYTVKLKARRTFDGEDLYRESRYWPPDEDDLTPAGLAMRQDLEDGKIFGPVSDDDWHSVFGDSQGLWASILQNNYDVLETTEVKRWLRKAGYDSFYVTGDGPKNIAVFHPSQVELVRAEPAYP